MTPGGDGPSAVLPTGRRLLGEYIIERALETGPLWSRYRGWRTAPNEERVQIRAVRWDAVSRPGVVEVFARYTRLIESFEHPSLVPAITSGVDRGVFAVVTRDPIGTTLREKLTAANQGRLEAVEVARIVIGLASVLEYLHGMPEPVVHGALDPAKILLVDPDEHVRLVDAGYAHVVRGIDPALALDDESAHAPAAYRTPEHFRAGHPLTPAADQFALASVAYECLAGEPRFQARDDIARRIFEGRRPWLASIRSDLSADVDSVLHRAWSIEPSARFRDVVTFAIVLARSLTANDEEFIARSMTGISEAPPPRDAAQALAAIPAPAALPGGVQPVEPAPESAKTRPTRNTRPVSIPNLEKTSMARKQSKTGPENTATGHASNGPRPGDKK